MMHLAKLAQRSRRSKVAKADKGLLTFGGTFKGDYSGW
jgi:hypothetical protein